VELAERVVSLLRTGGWVMWPLLLLSLASVTLTFERTAFWLSTHRPRRLRRIESVMSLARAGKLSVAASRAEADGSVYGRYMRALLDHAVSRPREAASMAESYAHEQAERLRPPIERFGSTMATIVTAAPMLGILGTVTGIIRSFRLLGDEGVVTDPTTVAAGIGEALFTTAFGLIIALVTIFPHAAFRAQSERCLSRFEVIAATIVGATRRQNAETDAGGE